MTPIAIAMVCKTPMAGQSKTRLSPPLRPEECAAISACFIRDLSSTIRDLAEEDGVAGCAVYTPRGSEAALRNLLPEGFRLVLQGEGDLGARLTQATAEILARGYGGVVLVNSDSPTLPKAILRTAVDAVRQGDNVALSPAYDGGYMLIGLSRPHARLFEDIPWSTGEVYRRTLERAQDIGLAVVGVPGWYDVDDEKSFRVLLDEFGGKRPPFASPQLVGADALATWQFLRERGSAAVTQC